MTQSHKNKQTLQVLSKKPFGKWKRKTVVLKRRVESQKTGKLYVYHPLQPKAIRKMYSTVIQISPYSHAVIQGLTEDGMHNVLGLLNLQENDQDNSPCLFFCAPNEQNVSDLHKLGEIIQDLCQVNTFAVTIDGGSTNGRIPAGPAYLHISKNRVFLSSKTSSTITILKEWQFYSLQTFHFEVCGIHIFDAVDHSQEEVFVACRSKEDNRSIQQIISLQCSPRTSTVPQPVLQRRPNELPLLPPPSISSSDNSVSLSPTSWGTQSPTESPVFLNFPKPDITGFGCHHKSTSTNEVCKPILKQTQSSPLVIKKTLQSPKHSVKEHVDIRFPTKKRSRSESDLRIRPLTEKEQVIILQSRAFSLDSNRASVLRKQKSIAFENEWMERSVIVKGKNQCGNTRENNFDVNAESRQQEAPLDHFQGGRDTSGAQSLPPPPRCELDYSDSDSQGCEVDGSNPILPMTHGCALTNEWTNQDSPHYVNCETRPNCFVYRNMSCLDDAPEIPKTYVNVFSGSSIKGCYENCHSGVFDYEFTYSSIDELIDEPPPLPQPRRPPPRLPPRVNRGGHKEIYPGIGFRKLNQGCANNPPVVPQRPPKRPPKSLKLSGEHNPHLPHQSDISSTVQIQVVPKIQVALFASSPTCGLVWFLRVAFMHQDESNTTFKRVTAIEEASNHKVVKSQLLEVSTDISVAVDVQSKGFDLLNDSQQEVESSDIDNLRKGDWFVIEFRIKQSDQTQVQFDGEVSVGPKAEACCGRLRKVCFGISENFLIKSPISSTEKLPTSKPLKINFSKYDKLCKALDPITNSSPDWRHVADALEFPREDIEELVAKYHRNVHFSPTDAILHTWEQRDPECSLKKLVNILRELERFDVVQDLGYSIEPEEKFKDGFKKI